MGFGRCLGNHTIVKGTGEGISRPCKGVLSGGGGGLLKIEKYCWNTTEYRAGKFGCDTS